MHLPYHHPHVLIHADLTPEPQVRAKTPLGIQAADIMRAGGLIPDSTMVKLIVGELTKRGWVRSRSEMTSGITMTGALDFLGQGHPPTKLAASNCPSSSFLLDGFPRTQKQAESLDEQVDMNLVCCWLWAWSVARSD